MDSPRKQLLEDGPPPPVRSGPGRQAVILTCGAIVAALFIIVVLNIDQERPSRQAADENVIELIAPPGRLSEADLDQGAADVGSALHPLRAQRGWIETRKRDGTPAQRYRCEALDPAPEGMGPGWLKMTQPRLEIFSERRIITIAGDTSLAFAPQRAIEQGTVRGNVLVKVFDLIRGRPANVELDQPSMVMRADEASFENFLGEIRADGRVVIETPSFTVPGRRLSVLIDDQNDEVRITMAQFDYIRIEREAGEGSPRTAGAPASALAVSRGEATSPGVSAARRWDEPSTDARFYVLTLRDAVRIDDGPRATRRTATGDRLEVIFSSRSEVLHSPLAHLPSFDGGKPARSYARDTMRFSHLPQTLSASLAVLSLATVSAADRAVSSDIEPLLGPNVTLVRASGPLTIEPLRDQQRALDRAEEARMELTGRPVRLCDVGANAEVVAHALVYDTSGGRMELRGSAAHPLRLSTPEMEAGGERWRFAQQDAEGGFEGSGWMKRRDRPEDEWLALACAAVESADERVPPRSRPSQPAEQPELLITWEEGVDFQFDDSAGGRVRSAIFRGNVNVASAEFNMAAQQMAVLFPEGGGSDAIESIHATGDVNVAGVFERAAIRCADLHMDLVQTAAGRTIPKLMIATGNVLAFDEEQAVWSDSLRVSFREGAGAAEAGTAGMGAMLHGRGIEVAGFVAERDVQVVLADGTRVFADRLTGDGVNETVELTAEVPANVAVVSDRMIIDQASRVTLDRKNGRASVPGAGQFRMYRDAVIPEADEPRPAPAPRVERPAIDEEENPMELRALWLRGMTFDGAANEGAGSLDLRGGVSIVSEPSALERNTMTGESLTMEFTLAEPSSRQDAEASIVDAGTDSELRPMFRSRRLATLIARQDAKIESHTWDDAEARREDSDPRIFYVAGHHVEYHALTGEALVVGDGQLLIHDVSPTPPTGNSAADAPFGARGSTLLTWDGKLELRRRLDNVFDMTATRNVRLRHRDLKDAISTLACDELNATVVRSAEGGRGELDFGGSARLERVRAAGDVDIRTDQRTITCGEFDYNVEAGVAQMAAAPDRVITILIAGSPIPMHAERAVWNMQRDTINITQARGGLRP